MREDKGRVGRKKVKGGNYVTTVVMYKIPLKLKKKIKIMSLIVRYCLSVLFNIYSIQIKWIKVLSVSC